MKRKRNFSINGLKLLAILVIFIFTWLGAKTSLDEWFVKTAETETDSDETQKLIDEAWENNTNNPYRAVDYTGEPYIQVNHNIPNFSEEEKQIKEPFETYSELDSLGRCGTAFARIGTEIMPTEERGEIGSVKPTGWHTVKYADINGNYLYNRCHLIAYCLAGENANEKNLITGTRYLNINGMLDFEMQVLDYVKETGNHVLYRATPIFQNQNLVAEGVLLEAYSQEDNGEGVQFCVFCYNVQPGVSINYATGASEGPEYVSKS